MTAPLDLEALAATMRHAKATDDAPGVAWGEHIMRFDDVLAAVAELTALRAMEARLLSELANTANLLNEVRPRDGYHTAFLCSQAVKHATAALTAASLRARAEELPE